MYKIILLILLYSISYGDIIGITQRIIDGDTIVLRDMSDGIHRVRLQYIDTPEKFTSAKLTKELSKTSIPKDTMKSMGIKSQEFLEDILGTRTISTNISKLDLYGRSLAVLQIEGQVDPVNLQMVEYGYACVYKKAKYPREYLEAENSAKTKRVGLWSDYYMEMSALCKP